mmetsp:Transcript_2466/g.3248  ORF Transcript_2466/g.3248 Transcript_2466/m.3248 type:complete len:504 (-) Transcript_2466:28-1539(-)
MEAQKPKPNTKTQNDNNNNVARTPDTGLSETAKNILLSKAIETIKHGIDADEAGKLQEALEYYNNGLEMMMNLLKNETHEGRKDMFRIKIKEILERAERVKDTLSKQKQTAPPQQKPLHTSQEHIISTIEHEQMDDQTQSECEVILTIEGVECFSIIGNDKHLISSGTLQLLHTKDTNDLFLLKLGQFEFPLTQSIPCLRYAKGTYLVPMPGNIFYGFVFPKHIPEPYLNVFESKLDQMCILRKQENVVVEALPQETQAVAPTTSTTAITTQQSTSVIAIEKIGQGIEVGSKYAVQGIEATGKFLVETVAHGGQYIKAKITPNETPAEVNPKLASTLAAASMMTPIAVKMSKALIKGLVTVAEEIGAAVADSIAESEWGQKMQSSGKTKSPTVIAAKQVGMQTLLAVSNVWDALETAGRTLLQQSSQTTVELVDYKYGKPAADVTANGLSVVMDVAETAYSVKQLGAKSIVKKVAVHTGKETAVRLIDSPEDEEDKPKMITES